MNTNKPVIQTLAAVAANHYRIMGADEDSNRLAETLHTAAQAYQTTTEQPNKALEQAWAMVTAEKKAAEQELPLTSTTPDLYDPADTESLCTALLEIVPQLESPDAQQAVQATISYLKDYVEGCAQKGQPTRKRTAKKRCAFSVTGKKGETVIQLKLKDDIGAEREVTLPAPIDDLTHNPSRYALSGELLSLDFHTPDTELNAGLKACLLPLPTDSAKELHLLGYLLLRMEDYHREVLRNHLPAAPCTPADLIQRSI